MKSNAWFTKADAPPLDAPKELREVAEWYAWSDEICSFFEEWAECPAARIKPQQIELPGIHDYAYTYSLGLSRVLSKSTRAKLRYFGEELFNIPKPSKIIFLSDVFASPLSSASLHSFLAFMRRALAKLSGEKRMALYSRLGDTGAKGSDFPLHADLYLGQLLLNIFDDVPSGGSGASIFLDVKTMLKGVRKTKSVPRRVHRRISKLLNGPLKQDGFEELYNLLHGIEHDWVDDMEKLMDSKKLRIVMKRGEGYLIHDRSWLHGREQPRGGVSKKRIRRLVFNNRALCQ